MKRIFYGMMLLLLSGVGAQLFAQQAAEGTAKFEVYTSASGAATVWFVNSDGLKDAKGQQLAQFKGGYEGLIVRLYALHDHPDFKSYELDVHNHKLVIDMNGKSLEALAALIRTNPGTSDSAN